MGGIRTHFNNFILKGYNIDGFDPQRVCSVLSTKFCEGMGTARRKLSMKPLKRQHRVSSPSLVLMGEPLSLSLYISC